EFGPPLDDVDREAVGEQHVEAGDRLVDRREAVAGEGVAGDRDLLPGVVEIARDQPPLGRRLILAEAGLDDVAGGGGAAGGWRPPRRGGSAWWRRGPARCRGGRPST